LCDLRDRGWTMAGIAREFDVPVRAINYHAQKYAVSFPCRGVAPMQPNLMQVRATRHMKRQVAADLLGICLNTLDKWRRAA
jgi:DNA-binding transcriptional regulator YiaG